jgi:hypothetical protein
MSKKMSHRKADLGDQYHEIGITAVAAAVRYQGDNIRNKAATSRVRKKRRGGVRIGKERTNELGSD